MDPDDEATVRGLAPGRTLFGRYTLEAVAGRGGMGVVWRAHDGELGETVALKVLPEVVAHDAGAVDELREETRRARRLRHPNIVSVFDFVRDGTLAAFSMEYVDGATLASQRVEQPGKVFTPEKLAPLVAELCAALDYAHTQAKVVHRDLKPANLLVNRDGRLKVTDFGIARSLSDTHTRLTGRAGGTSGTLPYMSPQQLMGAEPTAADDIYALGATLYELLTGKPPFHTGDVTLQIREATPQPVNARRATLGIPGVPPAWEQTIQACLAKEPKDRPQGAGQVAARLGLVAPGAGPVQAVSGAGAAGPPPVIAAVLAPRKSRLPLYASLAAAALLLAGAGYYFGFYRPAQQRLAAEQDRNRQAAALRVQQDQQAYANIMDRIASLPDDAPAAALTDVRKAVQDYLQTAPDRFRDEVNKAWNNRSAAWQARAAASQPGRLVVQTDPPGAMVTLFPSDIRKSSPAVFDGVKPGQVSLRVEKDGYTPQDVPLIIKPGVSNQAGPIRLVAAVGSLAITSDPPGIPVVVDGNGRRWTGRTPFSPGDVPSGDYRVTFQRQGWGPQTRMVTVPRGKAGQLAVDLRGAALQFRSEPPGAQVALDRRVLGVAPLQISGVEPRDHLVTAALEGYANYSRTIRVMRDDVVLIPMTETPMHRMLARLTDARWVHEAQGRSAELTFGPQGQISGEHHVEWSVAEHDSGQVESYDAATGTLEARFAASPPHAFYAEQVRIKFLDNNSIAVFWTAEVMGRPRIEHLVFRRAGGY